MSERGEHEAKVLDVVNRIRVADELPPVSSLDEIRPRGDMEDLPPLRVESALPQLTPFLSPQALAVYARQRHNGSPEMFIFGRCYDVKALGEREYIDYANRINLVAHKLDGRVHDGHLHASLEACMSMPLRLPLAGGRMLLISYLYVYDLPCWWYVDGAMRFDDVEARRLVQGLVGDLFKIVREGELP